jgi:hypothetical protein
LGLGVNEKEYVSRKQLDPPYAIDYADGMSERPKPKSGPIWPAVLALLAFALVVRTAVLVTLPDGLSQDPDGYRRIAENVLRSGAYSFDTPRHDYAIEGDLQPTAYRPPLYPLLLTKFDEEQRITPYRVGVLHLLLGLATVWLTWKLGMLWKLGHWSLVAGALVACDPILLHQSTQVMTETFATFLAVLALYSLTRLSDAPTPWNAALAGGALALAVLCRPTFLPWLALALLFTPFLAALSGKVSGSNSRWILRPLNFAAMLLAAAAVLAPWGVRNHRIYGRPIITTTHGGYTLALGNNASFYRYLREGKPGTVWDAEGFKEILRNGDYSSNPTIDKFLTHAEIELEDDQFTYQVAKTAMWEEPLTFLYSCLYRVAQLWSPLPHDIEGESPSRLRQLARFPIAAWYVVLSVLAIGGGWSLGRKLWRAPWLWGVMLCLVFTAVHALYWSSLRMRAPLVPFVCLLAAIGVAHLVHYLRRVGPVPPYFALLPAPAPRILRGPKFSRERLKFARRDSSESPRRAESTTRQGS